MCVCFSSPCQFIEYKICIRFTILVNEKSQKSNELLYLFIHNNSTYATSDFTKLKLVHKSKREKKNTTLWIWNIYHCITDNWPTRVVEWMSEISLMISFHMLCGVGCVLVSEFVRFHVGP